MQNMAVAKSFEAMLALTRKMKRVRAIMLLWQHRLMMAAFIEWSDLAQLEASQRQAIEQRQSFHEALHTTEQLMSRRVLVSAAQKMRMRSVVKSLNAWRSFTVQRADTRLLLAKVVVRIQNVALASAFAGWQHTIAQGMHVRRAA